MTPLYRRLALALSVTTLCACSLLQPTPSPSTAFYTLNSTPQAMTKPAPTAKLTLILSAPRAAAGFDSSRIIYTRQPHQLEYFAHSEWVDPPARMLVPLMAAAIEKTGAFRAVVMTPASATGDLRLETEIIRLQQEFQTSPSRVHFTLRASLVDDKTRHVVAWREFDGHQSAASEDAQGGIVAAHRVVQSVLKDLAAFCAEVAPNARQSQ